MIEKFKKFFCDPDWPEVEKLLREYIEPLRDLSNIKTEVSNDELASEVRGRQIAYERLNKFLEEVGMFKGDVKTETESYE